MESVITELNQKIGLRKDHYCNFIDDCVNVISPNKVVYRYASNIDWLLNKVFNFLMIPLSYRVYATLLFVFIIDDAESELAVLDLI